MKGPSTSVLHSAFFFYIHRVCKIKVTLGGCIAYANGIWTHDSDVLINGYE
jgi:hypothetical protein